MDYLALARDGLHKHQQQALYNSPAPDNMQASDNSPAPDNMQVLDTPVLPETLAHYPDQCGEQNLGAHPVAVVGEYTRSARSSGCHSASQQATGTPSPDSTESLPEKETAAIWEQVAVLLSIIKGGCRRGFHRHIARVPADAIASLRATLDPAVDPAEFDRRARLAGETVTLATVVWQIEDLLRVLATREEETFWAAAEVGLALAYVPPAAPDRRRWLEDGPIPTSQHRTTGSAEQ